MKKQTASAAFTRIELAAVTAALALVGGLAAPMLAGTRNQSDRAHCANNLKQISRAVGEWASEHQERVPWLTPIEEGGTLMFGKAGYAPDEYYALKDQLRSPKVLVCPADAETVVAPDWDSLVLDPNYGPNSVSYSLGLHAFSDRPLTLLAADRNIRDSGGPATCAPTQINNARRVLPGDPNVGWTSAIHGNTGNVLLNDGTVLFTDSTSLRNTLAADPATDNGALHILRAR